MFIFLFMHTTSTMIHRRPVRYALRMLVKLFCVVLTSMGCYGGVSVALLVYAMLNEMGWDGMGWDGMGWDEAGWFDVGR